MGLVKLYRVTRNTEYLQLAKYFLEVRGSNVQLKRYPPGSRFAIYNDPVQVQAHQPILEQSEAVGHAVRAAYMFSGMADVAALTQEAKFVSAIGRLWENVVFKKLYLTGGIGARHNRECFGKNYELPNKTAYNETCAAIGNVFWNYRLFLLHGDGKYLDVMERTLYNGVISGVSLEGDRFFYPNPLESDGIYEFNKGVATRKGWFDVACCPGNIVRFLPSVPGYFYAYEDGDIYVNLYARGTGRIDTLTIHQETNYPWDGNIKLTFETDVPRKSTVHLRIPGWARGNPVPSDLYRYKKENFKEPTLFINGNRVELDVVKGFARVEGIWKTGDVIELDLPMAIRKVESHVEVRDNLGRAALERGPLVYCAEGVDNGGRVSHITIQDVDMLRYEFNKDLLGGVGVITDSAKTFIAIPYYAWSHRGVGEMAVWLPVANQ
jgi:DUF1680 family protein